MKNNNVCLFSIKYTDNRNCLLNINQTGAGHWSTLDTHCGHDTCAALTLALENWFLQSTLDHGHTNSVQGRKLRIHQTIFSDQL